MKKNLLSLAFASAALFAVSCSEVSDVNPDDENNEETTTYAILTFEDEDWAGEENYTGAASWSSLIDDAEYGGSLLYAYDENWNGASEYVWSDENNTYLAVPELLDSEWGYGYSYSNGGIAVSNYTLAVAEGVSYYNQLSVPQGGNNGSDNFAVAFLPASLYFADSTARTVDHLYISTTTYLATVCEYGNDYSEALGADSYYKVIASGLDASGSVIATSDFYLAKDGAVVDGWNKWDLSSLGAISSLEFSIESDVANDWGISLPTYFAIDDVAVVIE